MNLRRWMKKIMRDCAGFRGIIQFGDSHRHIAFSPEKSGQNKRKCVFWPDFSCTNHVCFPVNVSFLTSFGVWLKTLEQMTDPFGRAS